MRKLNEFFIIYVLCDNLALNLLILSRKGHIMGTNTAQNPGWERLTYRRHCLFFSSPLVNHRKNMNDEALKKSTLS